MRNEIPRICDRVYGRGVVHVDGLSGGVYMGNGWINKKEMFMFDNKVCVTETKSQGGSITPNRQAEVVREIGMLSAKILTLREVLEISYKKLSPILANFPTNPPSDQCKPEEESCFTEVGKAIRSNRTSLDEIIAAVRIMHDRIEV